MLSVLGINEGTSKRRVPHIFKNIWYEALNYKKVANIQMGREDLKQIS